MKNHTAFSPRKDRSFFALAHRDYFEGGAIFTKPNLVGHERYALHVAKTSTAVERNHIKRVIRGMIKNTTSPKHAHQDVFISISNWRKASAKLICNI